ncbi:MAG TPA: hypothetical protein VLJ17_24725 [Xanthobacteraceae bacterium]|nr:hypothetical protein [Xanthobacteraceae bacterium]
MRRKTDVASIDAKIKKWNSRLKRAVNAIAKLELQKKRLLRPTRKPGTPVIVKTKVDPLPASLAQEYRTTADDLDVPAFLKRSKDETAKAEIQEQQAEKKRQKTAGRIAKLKADKAGERKQMPLSGKDALAYIKGAMARGEKIKAA